jgi:hypothetical protein
MVLVASVVYALRGIVDGRLDGFNRHIETVFPSNTEW